MKVDESLMCSAMEITVWLKSLWTDTVALTGEGEANNLNDIRRLNKWNCNAIQQSVQFLSVHELRSATTLKKKKKMRITVWFIYFKERKSAAVRTRCGARTYNSQFPECSSARPVGISSDPSCRRLSSLFWIKTKTTRQVHVSLTWVTSNRAR